MHHAFPSHSVTTRLLQRTAPANQPPRASVSGLLDNGSVCFNDNARTETSLACIHRAEEPTTKNKKKPAATAIIWASTQRAYFLPDWTGSESEEAEAEISGVSLFLLCVCFFTTDHDECAVSAQPQTGRIKPTQQHSHARQSSDLTPPTNTLTPTQQHSQARQRSSVNPPPTHCRNTPPLARTQGRELQVQWSTPAHTYTHAHKGGSYTFSGPT